ncbi:MAG: lysophospholipid acyltransferase family protein [Brevundimonas sp.]|uniref:lysophospholipid acyltransferase family protein n=1 Tax=Brevundimonas sp. TaxID=1871086 RepID=UPI002612843A|nr:lysophospholipid acyltransferase family protein [Brevundimonas sp.]MDI6625696.1 lysophospholipid acyltransferase family protein [Brevundimonas sp.]MDQ7814013.1 lysophospholipid acyltransferase family protein [Brevundimonas sp.]
MKPLRNPAVQSALGWIMAGWLRFCYATIRWEHRNRELVEAIWDQGGGVLTVFWHSRTSLAPAVWPLDRAQPIKGMISRSADGELLARAMARLGIPAVRGSSVNKDKGEVDKGGTQALRDGLRQLKVGGLAITPDGPRGPARSMAEGLPVLAKLSKAPVLFVGLSCNPAIRLNNWDQTVIPLPFGKGAVVWDRADFPEGAEPGDVVADWTARITAVEAAADAITGLERI